MRITTCALRQVLCRWPGCTTAQARQLSSPVSREVLLERLRRAKAEEERLQPSQNLWEDRRIWVLLAGLVASCAWAYSILGETSITDHVFMDVSIGGVPAGRLVLGLHGNNVPRASVNFLDLATHKCGYGYKGSCFYDVMPNFAIIGGDITKGDGTGGVAALGPSFAKEKSPIRHGRGTLSMITDDDNAVRSQFFICCAPSKALNTQMVAFGKVVEGMELVDQISALPTDKFRRPLQPVVISDCGKLEQEGAADGVAGWLAGLRLPQLNTLFGGR